MTRCVGNADTLMLVRCKKLDCMSHDIPSTSLHVGGGVFQVTFI